MASPGKFVRAPEWWKHLRKEKRTFWKVERKAAKLNSGIKGHSNDCND